MTLSINTKQPGFSTKLRGINLHAACGMSGPSTPEAYETLLYDVLRDEAALFLRADGIEALVRGTWADAKDVTYYQTGRWDVPGLGCLMDNCEGRWRESPA